MDIQGDINWTKAELSKVQDPNLIEAFKNLLQYRAKQVEADWWNEISQEEKSEIEQGIKELNNDDTLTHKEVMSNPRKWN